MKRGKFTSEKREKKWDERKLMRKIVRERELKGEWMREKGRDIQRMEKEKVDEKE